MTLRVVVATPVRLYREALALLLQGAEIDVVGTAADVGETLSCVHRLSPDVVVLDPRTEDGPDLAREVSRSQPAVRIVVFSATSNEQEVLRYAEAGVAGYVSLESSREDLVEIVQSAARGELLCPPNVAAALLRRVHVLAPRRPKLDESPLTARELEVAELMEAGLSNKQIALQLHIELATVKNHVHRILEKLDARRRGEAVARLRDQGVLGGPEQLV
jgi:two-component system nitrate/nitrite response regulator NarL